MQFHHVLILTSSLPKANETDKTNFRNISAALRIDVGAAPMVEQLKLLESVVIDAGFAINAPAKPKAR